MSAAPLTIREAMMNAALKARGAAKPECYRWISVWWHLHSKESCDSASALRYSRNMLDLRRDMLARPQHFNSIRKPADMTDFRWSQVSA